MSYRDMSIEEIEKLLASDETPALEFKESYHFDKKNPPPEQKNKQQWNEYCRLKGNEFIKDILSLANKNVGYTNQDGIMIIGACDKKNQDGIRTLKNTSDFRFTQKELLDKVNVYCNNTLPELYCQQKVVKGVCLTIIRIPPTSCLYETKKELEVLGKHRFNEDGSLESCEPEPKPYQEFSTFIRIGGDKIKRASEEDKQRIKDDMKSSQVDNTSKNNPQYDDKKRYLEDIERWANLVRLDTWETWTHDLVSGGLPHLEVEMYESLKEVNHWLFTRIWSGRYRKLEAALHNFRYVSADLEELFGSYAHTHFNQYLETDRFYRINHWNERLYDKRLRKFNEHVRLVGDLTLELTRAANYVCDMVRLELLHNYRICEGALFVNSDYRTYPFCDKYRVEYRSEEITYAPYSGIEKFKTIRLTREISFEAHFREQTSILKILSNILDYYFIKRAI